METIPIPLSSLEIIFGIRAGKLVKRMHFGINISERKKIVGKL